MAALEFFLDTGNDFGTLVLEQDMAEFVGNQRGQDIFRLGID